MPQELIDAGAQFLETLLGREFGTGGFYVVLGVTALAALLVGRLLAGVFGSERGLFAAFAAVFSPVALATVARLAAEVYLLPHIEAEWAPLYLPWAIFGLVAAAAVLLIASPIWELGRGSALLVFLMAAGAAFGGYYASSMILDLLEYGERKVEERGRRIDGGKTSRGNPGLTDPAEHGGDTSSPV